MSMMIAARLDARRTRRSAPASTCLDVRAVGQHRDDARRPTRDLGGRGARVAPAATSSSTGAWLRLWTTSGKPRLRRLRAMGRPMTPRPMNPTVSAHGRDLSTAPATVLCYRFFASALRRRALRRGSTRALFPFRTSPSGAPRERSCCAPCRWRPAASAACGRCAPAWRFRGRRGSARTADAGVGCAVCRCSATGALRFSLLARLGLASSRLLRRAISPGAAAGVALLPSTLPPLSAPAASRASHPRRAACGTGTGGISGAPLIHGGIGLLLTRRPPPGWPRSASTAPAPGRRATAGRPCV